MRLRQSIRNALRKFKADSSTITDQSVAVLGLLEKMYFSYATALTDTEYVQKYYPSSIGHLNEGGWCLLRKEFFGWGLLVMSQIRKSMTEQSAIAYKREVIRKGFEYLCNQQPLRRKFYSSFAALGVTNEANAKDILFKTLVTYSFHAYTKWRFQQLVKNAKLRNKSGDSSNVAFRLVQAARGKSVNKRNSDKCGFVSKAMKNMMKRYREIASTAVSALRLKGNDVDKIKKEDVCAILYCGYGEFYKHKNDSTVTVANVREKLRELRGKDEQKFLGLEDIISRSSNGSAAMTVAGAGGGSGHQNVSGDGSAIAGPDDDDTNGGGGGDDDDDDDDDTELDNVEDEDELLCNPIGNDQDEDALAQYLLDEEDEDEENDDDNGGDSGNDGGGRQEK